MKGRLWKEKGKGDDCLNHDLFGWSRNYYFFDDDLRERGLEACGRNNKCVWIFHNRWWCSDCVLHGALNEIIAHEFTMA